MTVADDLRDLGIFAIRASCRENKCPRSWGSGGFASYPQVYPQVVVLAKVLTVDVSEISETGAAGKIRNYF